MYITGKVTSTFAGGFEMQVLTALFAFAVVTTVPATKPSIQKLEGKWEVVERKTDGKKPNGDFDYYHWSFEGDQLTTKYRGPDTGEGGGTKKFSVDMTKTPAELTVTGDNFRVEAIYKFDGDKLIVAFFGKPEIARPKAFTAEEAEGNGQHLLVWTLKRSK